MPVDTEVMVGAPGGATGLPLAGADVCQGRYKEEHEAGGGDGGGDGDGDSCLAEVVVVFGDALGIEAVLFSLHVSDLHAQGVHDPEAQIGLHDGARGLGMAGLEEIDGALELLELL